MLVGGQALAQQPKLQVERRLFLASKVVIFGVNFTGPHILVVILTLGINIFFAAILVFRNLSLQDNLINHRHIIHPN